MFKALKYRSNYARVVFANVLEAHQWVEKFVHRHNTEHRRSAIVFITPNERHQGVDGALLKRLNYAIQDVGVGQRGTGTPY